MFAYTNACALLGTVAVPVRVEAHVERGLPRFTIVGLREADARESKERIRCGLLEIGISLPLQRITVNLAPADLPKAGASFDVAVVLAVLAAMGEVPADAVGRLGSHAEIGLDGCLRPVLGTMAAALAGGQRRWQGFLVPVTAAPAACRAAVPVLPAATLGDVVRHLRGSRSITPAARPNGALPDEHAPDLADVRGQESAVDALVIAAAGAHNMLMSGPPGCGKSMLAHRLPGLLPRLDDEAALEVATIADAAGIAERHPEATLVPFRSPHHTVSQAALIGGGSARPIIGELSLAHRGVLFLDELPEFRPSAVDALREPLEEHEVRLRRARWLVRYPARVQLVGAMNLCRCGRMGATGGHGCSCSPASRRAYRERVSGAVLDRFDLHIMLNLPRGALLSQRRAPSSAEVRQRVAAARQLQHERWGAHRCNGQVADVSAATLRPARGVVDHLQAAASRMSIGGRAQRSVLRVARTIADLDGRHEITTSDVTKAMTMCRRLEGEHD